MTKYQKVYTLVEVEKEGPKTGVVRSAVVDVNQSLIDDGLVECDKIGSTNYCWSFPSKNVQVLAARAAALEEELAAETSLLAETKVRLEAAKAARPESHERTARLEAVSALKAEIAHYEQALEALKDNDPVEIQRKSDEVEMCRAAANRWTDNIDAVKSWLVKKRNMSSKEANAFLKNMGVNPDMDYVK